MVLIFPGTWQLQPGHCQCQSGGQRDLHLPGQHGPSHKQGEDGGGGIGDVDVDIAWIPCLTSS